MGLNVDIWVDMADISALRSASAVEAYQEFLIHSEGACRGGFCYDRLLIYADPANSEDCGLYIIYEFPWRRHVNMERTYMRLIFSSNNVRQMALGRSKQVFSISLLCL